MAKKNNNVTFNVGITNHYFDAISRQKLPMSDAACEPVDNAISNCKDAINILVAIVKGHAKNLIGVVIADWGNGMSKEKLPKNLQFGNGHSNEGPLCIHGVGLNNFILVATRNKYPWFIASKQPGEDSYHRVDGPFATTMTMSEQEEIPMADVVMREQFKALGAPSTIIYVEMDKATASTMLTKNGSCAESRVTSLNVLRTCLAEHFGVKYRNYLAPDATGVAPARILIPDFHMANGKTCDVLVKPIFQPYKEKQKEKNFTVDYDGYEIPVKVECGQLDTDATKGVVTGGYDLKHFYQNNMLTQGLDIQLGERVIATAQFDTIWDKARHPAFNAFTGVVAVDISGLPRGFLNTLANKSDEAFQMLVDYFSDYEEPTIILMFGDHQPSVEQEFLDLVYDVGDDGMSMEEYMRKYEVPYLIWANYDLPEMELPTTSLNFLGQQLLRLAGIETTGYGQFLWGVQETLPAICFPGYTDAEGNAYSHLETNDFTPLIEAYRAFQYNNLFGGEERIQALYEPQVSPETAA